ncbi:glutathione S-transferase [Aurantivibrio plasticivorans]
MELVVGDCSTWSIRALMCLALAEINVTERIIPLGQPGYEKALSGVSDSMLVPVLIDGDTRIHDSLAIAEYANELSAGLLWLHDLNERGLARSLVCELHSGFAQIRTLMPFNWVVSRPVDISDAPAVQKELRRLDAIWSQAGSTFYFSTPSVVDAFYAVLAYRLNAYGITLSGAAGRYQHALLQWPLFNQVLERAKGWAS